MNISNISRKIIIHIGLVLYLGSYATSCFGQNTSEKDTLRLVENYASNKEFQKALNLLKTYTLNHTASSKATQLQLKITYWSNRSADLKKSYQQAITQFPHNQSLELDYAIYLYEHKENKTAQKLLEEYIKKDTINLEAKYTLGMIYYSNGALLQALECMNAILIKEPAHVRALVLKTEISLTAVPHATIQNIYYSDKQPITKLSTLVEYGIYRSAYLSPFVRLQVQGIKDHPTYTAIEIGNKIQFQKQFYVTLQGGIAKSPASTKHAAFIYDVQCKKNIGQYISIQAGIYSKPYLYTYSSLSTPVKPVTFSTSFNWGKTYSLFEHATTSIKHFKDWTVHSGYIYQHYQDNNATATIYAWTLSPTISWNNFQFRLGYAYSYANSNEVRYDAIHSLSDIQANWNAYIPVQGYYNPYFTPINQQIHSVIAQINYVITNRWYLNYKSTVGFYAHGDAPYIYLNNVNNTLTFSESLSTQRYTPFDLQLSTGIKLSNKTTCNVTYNYTRAFFFDSQQIQFGLKYIFTHE